MNWIIKIFKKKNKLSEEDLKWNKMWELWVDEELEQPISSLLTYDSEIQNGGHLQFFCNVEENATIELKDVLKQLKKILPDEIYSNLNNAYKKYKELNFVPETSDEYCDVAIEEPLLEFDNFYYEHEEEIQNILKEYASKLEI